MPSHPVRAERPRSAGGSQLVERSPIVALHVPIFTPKLLDVTPNLAPPDMVEERAVDDRIFAQLLAWNGHWWLAILCHRAVLLRALVQPLMRIDAESPIVVDPSAIREARAVGDAHVLADLLLFCVGEVREVDPPEKALHAFVHVRSSGSLGTGRSVARVIGCRSATGKRESENGEGGDSGDDPHKVARPAAASSEG